MYYIRFILLIILLTSSLFSSIINLDKNSLHKNILTESYIFIDKEKILTKNQILSDKNIIFFKNNKNALSYGYNPNFNVWIKFTLKNNSNQTINKILEYANPLTTDIVFYSSDNKYEGIKEGLFNINKNRKTINPIFNIELKPNETKVYYIKASSKITTLIIKLNLWDSLEFLNKESQHKFYLGLFFGSMLILIAYNFFIYLFTRDISYFYYISYIFWISFHHLIYVGLSNIYLNQKVLIFIIEWSSFLVSLPIISLALFTKSFLKVQQYKYWNIGLIILLILVILFAFFITFFKDLGYLRSSLILLLLFYLVLITVYAAYKKNRQAYFISVGWLTIFIAVFLMFLSSTGIFNVFKYIKYPIETTLVLEAVMFSIALADRINMLRKTKEKLKNKIISQQKNENKRLEKNVKIKTRDLQVNIDEKNLLLKELNHRVKNNMQMIISLLRLQSTDNVTAKNIDDILLTIQNRINAMSQLHEVLYKQDNIGSIDTYEYFYILCSELRYSYDQKENIDIKLDVKVNINVEDSLYCGLVLNELLTNSFKYAFPNGIGIINIQLDKEDNKYILIVSDNGVGYNYQNDESLGTILINSLVLNQLSGKIESSTNQGVYTKIEWGNNG